MKGKVCVVSKNGKEQALEEGIVEPYSVVEVRRDIFEMKIYT